MKGHHLYSGTNRNPVINHSREERYLRHHRNWHSSSCITGRDESTCIDSIYLMPLLFFLLSFFFYWKKRWNKWIQKKEIQKEERTSVPCPLSLNIYVKKQCRHINRAGYNNVCGLIDWLLNCPASNISVIFRMSKVCEQKIRKKGLWDGSTWATT